MPFGKHYDDDAAAHRNLCSQPQCELRSIEFNRTRLAELLVESISHPDRKTAVAEEDRIVPRKICRECALRVLRGQRPFPTAEENERLMSEIDAQSRHGFLILD